MAEGMFGSPVGTSAAIQDEYRAAATQEALGRLAMQPVEQRLRTAQAEAAELAILQERRMAELMQQRRMAGTPELAGMVESGATGQAGAQMEALALGGAKKSTSLADQFDDLAVMAADAGMVSKAGDAAKVAALLRSREAAARSSQTSARLNAIKAVREQAELAGQLLGGATDQATWDYNNALYEMYTGAKSPWSNQPYSSELAQAISDQALTAKERADADEKALSREDLDEYRKSRLKQHDAANALRKARNAIAKARERRLAKAGGKEAGTPARTDLRQAENIILKEFPKLEAGDLEDAAYTISAEAKALRKRNPALDANQALQQAFVAAKKAGDFKTEASGILRRDKTTFSGAGKTPQTPAALPGKDKLVKGRYYLSPTGAVGQWNGKGFELVGDLLSGDNSDPDEEDLDEDEE